MKIVNEKGKLFGIINIVDLLVLLIAAALVLAVGSSLLQDRVTEVVSQKEDFWFEVEIIGSTSRLYNEIERVGVTGKNLVAGNAYQNATIEAVWYEDYRLQTTDDQGNIIYNIDPTKKSVVLLIHTQLAPETATPSVANQDVRVGRTFIVKTQTIESTGTIRYAQFGEYTNTIPEDAETAE